MGLTFASPNGGNSQKTGNRNSNNNAKASAKTSSYRQGSGHPSAGAGAAKSASPTRARNNKQKAVRATEAKAKTARATQNKAVAAAKVKRETQAKIAKAEKDNKIAAYQAKVKANNKQKAAAKATKVTKAKAPKSFFSKMFDFIDGKSEPAKAPIGAIWDNASPQERGQSPVMQTPKLGGQGMQDSGAYYPQGFGKQLEAPSSPLGWASAAANPIAAITNQASKVLYNQSKYGMNEEAANEYQRLLQDPANAGMSESELVTMARKPQMDKQLPNAFIHDETGSTANAAQLDAIRPFIEGLNISKGQWDGLPVGMKRALAQGTKVNNSSGVISGGGGGNGGGGGGMFTGAPTAPEAPTLGQLTTGEYAPTERPSWAPNASMFADLMPPQQAPSFAPQWNQQPQQVPSYAPQWDIQKPSRFNR